MRWLPTFRRCGERAHLGEELGDLWLQVGINAQMAADRGAWDLHEVEAAIVSKLVRRHPHVFGSDTVEGAGQVLVNWEAIKQEEREAKGLEPERRLMEGIPASLSPMEEAMEIGKRCAKVGFEWPDMGGVLDKVVEEIAELQAESSAQRVEEEFGDVIFSLMQWARKKGVDPDRALRRQMMRFKGRFEKVEDDAKVHGGWDQRNLDQMEAAWQAAKKDADSSKK